MAYNFRPSSIQEIKDLGLPKNKESNVVELFNTMKDTFGQKYDEFITIETGTSNFGNVNILRDFSGIVDIGEYKKDFLTLV